MTDLHTDPVLRTFKYAHTMTNELLRNPSDHRAVFVLRGGFHLKPLFQYLTASPVSPVSPHDSKPCVLIPIVILYLLTLLHLLYTIIHASFLKDSSTPAA